MRTRELMTRAGLGPLLRKAPTPRTDAERAKVEHGAAQGRFTKPQLQVLRKGVRNLAEIERLQFVGANLKADPAAK